MGISKEQRQLQRLLRDHVKSAESCPKVAKFVPRQGFNRDLPRFPPNLYILLGLALFPGDMPKKIRDCAGIFRSIMELTRGACYDDPYNPMTFPAPIPEHPRGQGRPSRSLLCQHAGLHPRLGDDQGGIAGISRGNCRLFITNRSFRESHGNRKSPREIRRTNKAKPRLINVHVIAPSRTATRGWGAPDFLKFQTETHKRLGHASKTPKWEKMGHPSFFQN